VTLVTDSAVSTSASWATMLAGRISKLKSDALEVLGPCVEFLTTHLLVVEPEAVGCVSEQTECGERVQEVGHDFAQELCGESTKQVLLFGHLFLAASQHGGWKRDEKEAHHGKKDTNDDLERCAAIPEPSRAIHAACVDEHVILEPLPAERPSNDCHHTCLLVMKVVEGVCEVCELTLRATCMRLSDVELVRVVESAICYHE